MSSLIDWEKHLIIQRDEELGCIPTGYEWLIRMSDDERVDFTNFQEEFNLQRQGIEENNFQTIGDAVSSIYSFLSFHRIIFTTGQEKVAFITEKLSNNIPLLVSITLEERGTWHIMPVVAITSQEMKMVWNVNAKSKVRLYSLPITDVIYRHDNWPGGNDVAWLEINEADSLI